MPELCNYCLTGCYCSSPLGDPNPQTIWTKNNFDKRKRCDYCVWGCQRQLLCDSSNCFCVCQCCDCNCECQPILIDAQSYNQWIREVCYTCRSDCLTEDTLDHLPTEVRCVEDIGRFRFFIRTQPNYRFKKARAGELISRQPLTRTEPNLVTIWEGDREGFLLFNGPVHSPVLVQMRNSQGTLWMPKIWMSLTPLEIFSQRIALDRAYGRVLIAGLGMGWLTQRVLQLLSVDSVTQIELVPEIIEFFGRPLQRRFRNLELIEANVWDYLSRVDIFSYDAILFDIWPQYGEATFDKNFQRLKLLHRNVWGWGDFNEN